VERGAIESELMLNTGTPIVTSILKGAGTQAKGFTASSGMKSSDIKASSKVRFELHSPRIYFYSTPKTFSYDYI